MPPPLTVAVETFAKEARAKLSALTPGEPEDQLRAPLEALLQDAAAELGYRPGEVVAVGETAHAALRSRPDYTVEVGRAAAGVIEVKAPGKGANPRAYRGHDKEQWEKLRSLPNVLYTDGESFSLWQDGELVEEIVRIGDLRAPRGPVEAPAALLRIFEGFLGWKPEPPRSARALAVKSARLCHFLRDEVTELLERDPNSLLWLRETWRKTLFPEAKDADFADGYAQAVTFGMLVAKAYGISLADGLDRAADALRPNSSIIGAALRGLTEEAASAHVLRLSIVTMTRVFDRVDWSDLSKETEDAWLYFYEEFLDVYDKEKRKLTGSYYTPPEVVRAMVRLVDEALRSPDRFDLPRGLAEPSVAVVDPAVGTGTFLLGVLSQIARTVAEEDGEGAVRGAVESALRRLVGFEMQFGPFAVAQLRLLAEIADLTRRPAPATGVRLYVTNTLDDPNVEIAPLPGMMEPIAESRRAANQVKRDEAITVVIGNPPYKERALGTGAWVEETLLRDWTPPTSWKVSAHAKHLRNLYVYFWRWATWKVFEATPEHPNGVVAFITVAGFLNGPGFARMREWLRQRADEIWVIDASPEGRQPEVPTRIFQGVQQPVCIVIASRTGRKRGEHAVVRHRALPLGPRRDKFAALDTLALLDDDWSPAPDEGRAPFLPASGATWTTFPALEDLFLYDGSGVMPGRTWIIAPEPEMLGARWDRLRAATEVEAEQLFYPHLRNGQPGDKHLHKPQSVTLPGHQQRTAPVAKDFGRVIPPARYAFRSFDRQWIVPDARLINQPNPTLWAWHSPQQVYISAPETFGPSSGPALTLSAEIPDLHVYNGNGGRVFPTRREEGRSNLRPALLAALAGRYGFAVTPEDLVAYVAAVAAHPAYVVRFADDLRIPGLRIPLTAEPDAFRRAVELGKRVVWLHTYGERFADPADGRPRGLPRAIPDGPRIPAGGEIPDDANDLRYDAETRILFVVGSSSVAPGRVENVSPAVFAYEVSGKNVLRSWFSYRKRDRTRPVMGDRRPPSALERIQPDAWTAEATSELVALLHVLTLVVALEPEQKDLLDRILGEPLLSRAELADEGAFAEPRGGHGSVTDATLTFD